MNRIAPNADISLITQSLIDLPRKIRKIIGEVDFFCGSDPVFAGLTLEQDLLESHDAAALMCRSLRTTSHAHFEDALKHLPLDLQRSTIVISDDCLDDRNTILHELGHILRERLTPFWCDLPSEVYPICDYAALNYEEAFAVAFQSWLTPTGTDSRGLDFDLLYKKDPDFILFFNRLAKENE